MDKQPFLKSGLVTLLAGVSATAIFAVTGFIAAFGREQLLGVDLADWSAQRLTVLAGRCAADSFFLVLNLMAAHRVLLTIVAIIVAAGAVALRHRKFPAWVAPAAECVVSVPLLVWLLLVIIHFEAPTIPLRGWIVSPNSQTPLSTAIYQLHPKLSAESRRVSPAFVQNAISNSTISPGSNRLSEFEFATRPNGPGVLLLETASDNLTRQLAGIGFPKRNRQKARNILYRDYAGAVAACFLALIYIVLSRQCPESKVWSDVLAVLRTAIIAFSAVATVLLPYVYGKLFDSTLFPNAYVTYETPSTDTADGKPTLQSGQFPVISQTDASLSLLWIQSGVGHTQIIQVPREKVRSLVYVADVDALSKIAKCTIQPEADCQ